MKNDSTAAKLLGTTARLRSSGKGGVVSGTGFLYEVRVSGGGTRTFLVANRHQFLAASASLSISLVRRGPDGQPAWGQVIEWEVAHPEPKWFGHPDGLDVAVMPLGAHAQPDSVLAVSADVTMTRAQEMTCDALEEILTIGYPNGLHDPVNLSPISRRGITATPLGLDYDGVPAFCIDAATFQGSSGSPVFCLGRPSGGAEARFGIMGRRVTLAGVVTELHERCAVGDVRRVEAASALEFSVKNPMHLGVALKARTIDACVDVALAQASLLRATALAVDLPSERSA